VIERPPSKGGDRLKGAGATQRALVFADSRPGGEGQEHGDESPGKRFLLHIAKGKNPEPGKFGCPMVVATVERGVFA
jgi:hypothetical protein